MHRPALLWQIDNTFMSMPEFAVEVRVLLCECFRFKKRNGQNRQVFLFGKSRLMRHSIWCQKTAEKDPRSISLADRPAAGCR